MKAREKSTQTKIRYEGHRELFDNAWDEVLKAVADCRADHPEAEITQVFVTRSSSKRCGWHLEAEEVH